MAPELALVETGAGPEAALTWLEPIEPTDLEPTRLRQSPGRGGSGSPAWDRTAGAKRPRSPGRTGPAARAPSSSPTGPTGPAPSRARTATGRDRPGARSFAYWLAKNGDSTYAYTVQVARSDDGGGSWRDLGRLHSDETAAEHGFVSAVPERERCARLLARRPGDTADGGPMTLRTVRIGDAIDRSTEELLDDSVCDCCNTTAVLAEGGPLVVYRDRTADEIRDPWLVRRTGTDGTGRLERSGAAPPGRLDDPRLPGQRSRRRPPGRHRLGRLVHRRGRTRPRPGRRVERRRRDLRRPDRGRRARRVGRRRAPRPARPGGRSVAAAVAATRSCPGWTRTAATR